MANRRAFDANALKAHAVETIRAEITAGARAWKYTIFVPVEQINIDDGNRVEIATDEDLYELEMMFVRDFFGVTTGYEDITGMGPRDVCDPEKSVEKNEHAVYMTYAAPKNDADAYFKAVQEELQDALDEGLILVERQEVVLI